MAVAPSPVGPFKDPLGKPLVAKADFPKMQVIDPMVFVDDDGAAYLYWRQGRCQAVRSRAPGIIPSCGFPGATDG